jgi:hypothetical protein
MKTVQMPKDVKAYFESGPRKIVNLIANDDYTLTVHFDNGEVKLYDMNEMLYGIFENLKNKNKFKEAFIDEFGNIAWDINNKIDSNNHWNNRIDLCTDSVYLVSKLISNQR